jgi:hypothetical protein
MGMIVTRDRLDQMTCSHGRHDDGERCDGSLYMHSNCHPDRPTWAVYQNGTLRVECSKCKREILTVGVV